MSSSDTQSGLRSVVRWVSRHPLDAAAWITLAPLAVSCAMGWAPQALVNTAVVGVVGLLAASLLQMARTLQSLERSRPATRAIEDPTLLYPHVTRLVVESQPREARNRRIDLVSVRPRDHNPRERPAEQTEQFFRACVKRLDDGWTIRRLLAIDSRERLDYELERALPENARYELRAVTGAEMPVLAPLVIGRHHALLGLDDPQGYGIQRALHTNDPDAVELVSEYFGRLWDRPEVIVLRDQQGRREEGIERLRRLLLEHS
jgi:hypothetical protein